MRRLMACAGAAAMAVTLTGCVVNTSAAARPARAARPAHPAHPAAAPGTSFCGIRSLRQPRHAGTTTRSRVAQVRAGRHPCFDRLVIDLGAGGRPGYRVRYVHRIRQYPSGRVIRVRGGARLRITVLGPVTRTFPVLGRQLADVSAFGTFRQVAGAGSVDGITWLGLGVRARLPFRVSTLRGPGRGWRLVIDVAHRLLR